MQKNSKRHNPNYEILLGITFIVIIGVFCVLNFLSGKPLEYGNVIICCIQFLIAGAIFAYSVFKYFRRTNKMVSDLYTVIDSIKTDTDFRNNIYFSEWILRKEYNHYQEEYNRLQKISGSNTVCDIEDYINHELVDISINRSLLNLVPGAMTGLGILGTFTGLSLGLQFFNTGTAEEISNSIAPLMDGIKVAFHTSIYGMVFSLVYNYVYKKKLEEADKAMNEFLTVFHEYAEPRPENDVMNRMVNYQENQMAIASKMTEELSTAIADKMAYILAPEFQRIHTEMCSISEKTDTIGADMSKTLKEVLAPQFVELHEVLERFVETASRSQVDGIRDVVEKFVTEMNNALGDNFTDLGNVLEKTCNLQRIQTEKMQSILDRTDEMIDNITDINNLSETSLEKMKSYVEKIDELQKEINAGFEEVSKQTQMNNELLERHQTYMDEMADYEVQISKAASDFNDNLSKTVESLQQVGKEISDNIGSYCKSLIETAEKDVQKLIEFEEKAASDFNSNLSQTVESLQQMEKETSKNIGSYCTALIETTEKDMQKLIEFEEKATSDFKDSLSQTVESLQKMEKEITDNIGSYCNSLSDATEKDVQKLIEFEEQVNNSLKTTTNELCNTINNYNGELQTSLERTFDLFDQNLAEATSHLSGTIGHMNTTIEEIDKSMDRVPRVVAASYEGMELSFDKMQTQVEGMIDAMETLRRQMDAKLNLYNDI